MNNRAAFVRAVRGPMLLIALGVLFVLDQQTESLTLHRTWPILLILMGLFRLAEKLVAPPPPAGSYPYTQGPAGGVRP